MQNDRVQGVVKFFKSDKGYGFIWPTAEMSKEEKTREEIFFHISGVTQSEGQPIVTLRKGDEVEFEITEGQNQKPLAAEIVRLSTNNRAALSLPATSINIPLKKIHVPILLGFFKDLLSETNKDSIRTEGEREAFLNLQRALSHAETSMNRKGSHTSSVEVSVTQPATTETKKSRSRKQEAATPAS